MTGDYEFVCIVCGKHFVASVDGGFCGHRVSLECSSCQCKRLGHMQVGDICGRCGERVKNMFRYENCIVPKLEEVD